MNTLSKKVSLRISALGIAVVFFLGGYFVGHARVAPVDQVTTLANKEIGKPSQVDFTPFWQAWNTLNEKFVATHGEKTASDQDKVYGAIEGLTHSLGDPYTVFFPPVDAKMFESEISGNFEGIGVQIAIQDNVLTVVSPLKGTPAFKAGMKTGDKILKINGTSTQDMSADKAVSLIRGKVGTPVRLTLYRKGAKDSFEVSINREVIDIPTIDTKLRTDGIFVIQLYSFTEKSPALFQKALQEFVDSGSTKLVFDLRGNPGGYLDAAVSMASWFLPEGDVVVREAYGNGKPEEVYRSLGYNVFERYKKDLHLIILADEGSASASEILAGALQEHKIGKIVGTKTFGKGSVQELVKLTPDTSLKVTIARWLTPNGISISAGGLTPDYEVKIDPKVQEKDPTNDPQMQKAVDLLLQNKN